MKLGCGVCMDFFLNHPEKSSYPRDDGDCDAGFVCCEPSIGDRKSLCLDKLDSERKKKHTRTIIL
jgi:hypothetical protein